MTWSDDVNDRCVRGSLVENVFQQQEIFLCGAGESGFKVWPGKGGMESEKGKKGTSRNNFGQRERFASYVDDMTLCR